jgi:hypothetical protein
MANLTFPTPFDYGNSTYINGSLFLQVSNNNFLDATNRYPNYTTDPGVNISILPSNVLELNFPVGNQNVSLVMPLLLMLLNPNAYRVDILCSYPLSGQYDRLQRFLFYGTLIVALLFRRNGLIATAAIGVAMTYSALAAVHLFVLLTWYRFKSYSWPFLADSSENTNSSVQYGDVDYYGIFPIITATVVMLTPILTWSSTIRTHEARVVMVYWALLIFAAMIPTIYFFQHPWSPDLLESFAYCIPPDSRDECKWWNLEYYMTSKSYQDCNCVDFCALFSPTAPLREGTNMGAFIGLPISLNVLNKSADGIDKTYNFLWIIWSIALAQGALSLVSIQSSPNQVRNVIFRVLNADMGTIVGFFFKGERRKSLLRRFHVQDENYSPSNTVFRGIQRFFAKLSAFGYLFLTNVGAIIYPAVFVITIALNEFEVDAYPVSEQSDSVGAWSPFVGAGLIILASLVMDFHHTLMSHLGRALRKPLNVLRYGTTDRPENPATKRQRVERKTHNFIEACTSLSDHLFYLVRYRFWHIRTQLKFFREWWNDPENLSDPVRWAEVLHAGPPQVSDNPTWAEVSEYRWSMEQGKPECRCLKCGFGSVSPLEIHVEPKMSQDISAGRGTRPDEIESV